ncbi:MAG TPA: 4'-phosphopantetheinyl transferase superfamily protein [Candidatus Bathyarchaeia archaeon]|nr:4'-phosphopantetheinyl transferase superfamily protein [Candidatus Bathyarchaeia archaeon]
MMEIYAGKIPEQMSTDAYALSMQLVAPEKQRRIQQYRHREDAYRSLLGELLVRSVICKKCGRPNESLHFASNEYGKPFVTDEPDLHFNLSHSGEWVVCVFHTQPVGVDIEEMISIDFQMAALILSEKEQLVFTQKKQQEQMDYFYTMWTIKESVTKAIGKGLSIPVASIEAVLGQNGTFEVMLPSHSQKMCHGRQYDLDPRYKLAVTTFDRQFPADIKIIPLDKLCKELV